MKKTAAVIGHFGFGYEYSDGQTVKTVTLADELVRRFGEDEIERVDTHGRLRALWQAPGVIRRGLRDARNLVLLPARRGIRVYAFLIALARPFHRDCRVHYAVVGGWLPELAEAHPGLLKRLGCFDFIYAETETMKRSLEELGLRNVVLMPNCKKPVPAAPPSPGEGGEGPLRLCIFSRILREKGIEDAAGAVRRVNEERGGTAVTLDLFGPVDPGQTDWFAALRRDFPEEIRYRGAVTPDRGAEILKDHDALLFPTRFFREGLPGSILDAWAAGVPVIASRWESFGDIISEGETGLGYPFGDAEELVRLLREPETLRAQLWRMRDRCRKEYEKYTPQKVLDILTERFLRAEEHEK